jgi:hypothetical protein
MTPTLAALFTLAAAQATPQIESDFETALGTAGLTTQTARFDPAMLRFFQYGEFASPFFDACSENPWRIPFYVDISRRQMVNAVGRPSELASIGAGLMGFGTRRTLLGSPIQRAIDRSAEPRSLERVLEAMSREGLLRGGTPALGQVPQEVRQATALLLEVMLEARVQRRLAFRNVTGLSSRFEQVASGKDTDIEGYADTLGFYRSIDMKYLMAGGHDLLLAAQTAQGMLGGVPPQLSYDVQIDTTWGLIRLTGGSNTVHEDRETLIIIDTGGNDTYVNVPANKSLTSWASVVIDTNGNDHYVSNRQLLNLPIEKWPERKAADGRAGPGGALFGYSILIDVAGDDVYRSHLPAFGSGRFGVAAVLDRAGNDLYDSYRNSQGFGMFGVGILEDLAGDDAYHGFFQVQGVGQTMGFGLLLDRAGNDAYVANDQVIDIPSPQTQEHNVSMAQGAGNGRRGDYLEGHSLAGGVGILFDQQGDDTYSCGVFGQGVGYWMGVGMLWDSAGNDRYTGQWYVQGASAHFAVGYLEGGGGADSYTALMNMAQGAGHDFSIGMLIDREGDDTYQAPNLSLGSGNANGIGIFADLLGDDTYRSSGITLGRAAEAPKLSLRSRALTLGLFMDLAGRNVYPEAATWARNATRVVNWTDREPRPEESHLGIFWDR